MAGLRAAVMAPTWPDINGLIIPAGVQSMSPGVLNFFNNPITIHFIHRGLAYLLFFLVVLGWFKSRKIQGNSVFSRLWLMTLLLIITQVVLGVLTVLNAFYAGRLLWFGVGHQFVGILLVIMITGLLYITGRRTCINEVPGEKII